MKRLLSRFILYTVSHSLIEYFLAFCMLFLGVAVAISPNSPFVRWSARQGMTGDHWLLLYVVGFLSMLIFRPRGRWWGIVLLYPMIANGAAMLLFSFQRPYELGLEVDWYTVSWVLISMGLAILAFWGNQYTVDLLATEERQRKELAQTKGSHVPTANG